MKILITGGAGFIGSALIREIMINQDDSVLNLDSLTYAGNLKRLDLIKNVKIYKTDINNTNYIIKEFEGDIYYSLITSSGQNIYTLLDNSNINILQYCNSVLK